MNNIDDLRHKISASEYRINRWTSECDMEKYKPDHSRLRKQIQEENVKLDGYKKELARSSPQQASTPINPKKVVPICHPKKDIVITNINKKPKSVSSNDVFFPNTSSTKNVVITNINKKPKSVSSNDVFFPNTSSKKNVVITNINKKPEDKISNGIFFPDAPSKKDVVITNNKVEPICTPKCRDVQPIDRVVRNKEELINNIIEQMGIETNPTQLAALQEWLEQLLENGERAPVEVKPEVKAEPKLVPLATTAPVNGKVVSQDAINQLGAAWEKLGNKYPQDDLNSEWFIQKLRELVKELFKSAVQVSESQISVDASIVDKIHEELEDPVSLDGPLNDPYRLSCGHRVSKKILDMLKNQCPLDRHVDENPVQDQEFGDFIARFSDLSK